MSSVGFVVWMKISLDEAGMWEKEVKPVLCELQARVSLSGELSWPLVIHSVFGPMLQSPDSRIISVGGETIVSPLNSRQNLGAVTFSAGGNPEVSLLLALFRFGPFVSCILNGCYNLWDIACADMELGQVPLFPDLWEGKIHTIRKQEHYFCLGKQPRNDALQSMAKDLVKI